jgi:hypothetical protein
MALVAAASTTLRQTGWWLPAAKQIGVRTNKFTKRDRSKKPQAFRTAARRVRKCIAYENLPSPGEQS